MPKWPFYAVHRGRRRGIFTTWAETERIVRGFAGARYKGFNARADAEAFVATGRHDAAKKPRALHTSKPLASEFDYEIYTDGGCIGNQNVAVRSQPAGWGVVVSTKGSIVDELYGPVELDKEHDEFVGAEVKSNNTGELSAMAQALRWLQRDATTNSARINYDSEYAAKITQRIFAAHKNRELALTCQNLLEDVRKSRTVDFRHVKGHSGDMLNERADALVQLGSKGLRSSSSSSDEPAPKKARH